MAGGKKGKQAEASDADSISSTKAYFSITDDSDSSGYVAASNKRATKLSALTKGGTAKDRPKEKPKKKVK
jgi:hypothetical protein